MKKIFFFAAALVAAATINAQTYDFADINFAESDLTVTNGTVALNADKYEVKNNAGETVTLTIAQIPNVTFSYKNTQEKTAFKAVPGKYIQMDGDQRDITFSGLTAGTQITLTVASKGGTANSFEDSDTKGAGLNGCIWVSGNKKQAAKESGNPLAFEDVTVQAIQSTVTIRCTAGGYCLSKIVIGGGNAIDNANAEAVKAVKYMENGQLIIEKNGVKYNALGAVIAE